MNYLDLEINERVCFKSSFVINFDGLFETGKVWNFVLKKLISYATNIQFKVSKINSLILHVTSILSANQCLLIFSTILKQVKPKQFEETSYFKKSINLLKVKYLTLLSNFKTKVLGQSVRTRTQLLLPISYCCYPTHTQVAEVFASWLCGARSEHHQGTTYTKNYLWLLQCKT